MAYQAKELFKLFGDTLGSEEVAKLEPDTELTDEQFEAIQTGLSGLMTKDAVLNNADIAEHFKKELYPVHKKSALSEVEQKLIPLAEKLGIDINGKYASDIVSELYEPVESALSSKTDPKSKELLESYKADIGKLREELESTKTESQKQLEATIQDFKRKELLGTIKSKIKSHKWADAYQDEIIQNALVSEVVNKLQSKAHLTLEDGQIGVYQKDLPEKELFEGNKKVSFQNLVEPLIEPYLKKSDPQPVERKPVERTVHSNPMLEYRQRQKDELAKRQGIK